jgi:hypothetical protein
MTAITNGNRIDPMDLNRNEAPNLGNAINLNGGNITIKHLDKLYYTDQRPPEKTLWQTFAEAFAHSAGWTTGAKAKMQKPGK